MAEQRSRSQIEADLAAVRTRLSANVEHLVDQVHPVNVKRRQTEEFKAFAQGEIDNAKLQFRTADGQWRTDRIAIVVGSVVGVIAFVAITRAIVSKASSRND